MLPPPPLPKRHPSRAVRSATHRNPFDLPSSYLDRWERATFLYYNLDWQTSSEDFADLSDDLNDYDLESTLCRLNAAIILARLNDFHEAAKLLEGAKHVDELDGLRLFVEGNVKYALGCVDASARCFKLAMDSLHGRPKHYRHLGLEFELDPGLIQHNLSALTHGNQYTSIVALPADSVFEVPARSPAVKTPGSDTSHSRSRGSMDLGLTALPSVSSVSGSSIATPSPTFSHSPNTPVFAWASRDIPKQPLTHVKRVNSQKTVDETKSKPSRSWSLFRRTSSKKPTEKLRKPRGDGGNGINCINIPPSYDESRANQSQAPRRRDLQPREARVKGNMMELAATIRAGPEVPRGFEAEFSPRLKTKPSVHEIEIDDAASSIYSKHENESEGSSKHDSMISSDLPTPPSYPREPQRANTRGLVRAATVSRPPVSPQGLMSKYARHASPARPMSTQVLPPLPSPDNASFGRTSLDAPRPPLPARSASRRRVFDMMTIRESHGSETPRSVATDEVFGGLASPGPGFF